MNASCLFYVYIKTLLNPPLLFTLKTKNMNFTQLFGSLKFDMYWFFNSKTYNPEEEITSIFDIDDYDKVKFEVGKTYTFNVDDLSVNDASDETKNDYEQYIKDKNQITILINWMKIDDSDEDGIDCNVGFSFISH